MKRIYLLAFLIITASIAFFVFSFPHSREHAEDVETIPSDWFFLQRSFPYKQINYQAREMAYGQYMQIRKDSPESRGEGWLSAGPLNIGGRISAVAINPDDQQNILAGAASGGVFRTNDQGQTWTAVFDDALSLSIGDIAISPSAPQIIYVGTGEANAGGGSITYDGFGIYRSDDGGNTWIHKGLENSGSIGRIAVNPSDPQTVFVAAMGRLFSKNEERGVFRSKDGGDTWEKVLYVSDSTGAIDVVINPQDPDIIYACLWERVRTPDKRVYGGLSSGIYRSLDGGDNWSLLSGGLPASSAYVGRIGIDISQSDPDILYAIYADDIGYFDGIYRSNDGGDNWIRTNDGSLTNVYSSYGWWFGRISIDPLNPNIAFVIGFDLYKTSNGGNSWNFVSSNVHVDQHDIVQSPDNPGFAVLGNDGGIYLSYDNGNSWTHLENLPITQFNTCEVDNQHPERLYGGTQDNGTNRTLYGGLNDWQNIYWGDGFYVLVDPLVNDYLYAEYQYGSFARSTNGGLSFTTALSGISDTDRKNWNTPVVFDPSDPSVLYYGANRLYKSTNRAVSWSVISPDLSNGPGNYNQVYGTITCISVAASDNQYIYAGTDDGNVWRTADGGSHWSDISAGLPERWVTRVAADPYDATVVYVCLSGYRYDSYQPHVFRSSDAGDNWQDISGNLPEAPVNDIIVDPALDSTLYIATDFGIYLSYDLGVNWNLLGTNLPNVPVTDLTLHESSRKLIAATYGRSMYTFSLDQLVSTGSQYGLEAEHNINIYPNPSYDGKIFLNYKPISDNASVIIFNVEGKRLAIFSLKKGESIHTLHLENMNTSVCILKVYDDEFKGAAKCILK